MLTRAPWIKRSWLGAPCRTAHAKWNENMPSCGEGLVTSAVTFSLFQGIYLWGFSCRNQKPLEISANTERRRSKMRSTVSDRWLWERIPFLVSVIPRRNVLNKQKSFKVWFLQTKHLKKTYQHGTVCFKRSLMSLIKHLFSDPLSHWASSWKDSSLTSAKWSNSTSKPHCRG